MSRDIPQARFRLEHTFAGKPDLVVDQGPRRSILVGKNSPEENIEAIFLGKHAELPHRDVWMDVRGAHVLYVMGKRRSGKSYTLGTIAESLVTDTWVKQGDTSPAVLILDTMNVFLTMPYSLSDFYGENHPALNELRKWKLGMTNIPLTLFTPPSTEIPSSIIASELRLRASDLDIEEWCGLFELDPFIDPMGHLLSAVLDTAKHIGAKDKRDGTKHEPKNSFGIDYLMWILEFDQDIDEFPLDTKRALMRRLEAISRYDIFGETGIDIHNLVKPGEISVLLLRDLEPEMRSVMVALIVKRVMKLRAIAEQQERVIPIHLAKAEQLKDIDPEASKTERQAAADCIEKAKAGLPRCWLIIDEAHNYVPSKSSVPSRKPLKKYVDEGRNLGLSIVVATQQPSGLDPSIQRNADLLLIHSLSHQDDIHTARGMINTATPEEVVVNGKQRISGPRSFEALIRSLPIGYALVSTDRASRIFPMLVRPRNTFHGGADY